MTLEEVKANVGRKVMSRDAGAKMIRDVSIPHGPYILKQVTKKCQCILEGREAFRVAPSLLTLV